MTPFKPIQFCMLNIWYVYFWVPWVTLWYPKIIVLKSMMSRLSNAVSDTFFGCPSAFLQCYEVWSFLRIFRGKITFWNVPWKWINHECFKFCTLWSRKAIDIILFSTIIFGYHNATHAYGTQKYTYYYVEYKKLNRLKRGHF